ncbi:ABC transporter ATP-binding protein [Prolixibacteraceae bacterium JC049]|nr:ABC transporter ATP-binding protein [Prolixibacteraceae bacterium JC049]
MSCSGKKHWKINLKKIVPLMLKISNVSKKLGKQSVLNDFSLETKQSGIYLIVGVNGCGKTTLFSAIAGFIGVDSGAIELDGKTNADEYRSLLGVAIEPFETERGLTVDEICKLIALEVGASNKEVDQWLSFWELSDAREKKFKSLSVGMKKRLSLILSLLGNRPVLLWDEPLNGLDPVGMKKWRELVKQLEQENRLILMSTHILGEMDLDNTYVLLMENGHITHELSKDEKLRAQEKQEQIVELLTSST